MGITLLLAATCLGAPDGKGACSCVFDRGTIESQVASAVKDADAVFAGLVVRIDTVEVQGSGGNPMRTGWFRRATLVVRHEWKGSVPDTLVVWTPAHGASCGYPFRADTETLVFATRRDESSVFTYSCTLTQSYDVTSEYVRALGRPAQAPNRRP